MKKVSELEPWELDYYVAKIEKIEGIFIKDNTCCTRSEIFNRLKDGSYLDKPYSPTSNWATGGPLIEKYFFKIKRASRVQGWEAEIMDNPVGKDVTYYADTILEAAMCALVHSKYGGEVEEIE